MRHLHSLCNLMHWSNPGSCIRWQSTAAAAAARAAAPPAPCHWEPVIGLEVHAQIQARSKLFSAAAAEFAAPVNAQVHLFDAAFPGTLPVLNRRCVEAGILTALALGMRVNTVSTFDRKHYFYADLPAGYQITQQRRPLAEGGELRVPLGDDAFTVRLARLQLEQDSGKSLHDPDNHRSLIDLNRAGVGLMELVFEPDVRSAEEAAALVKELILVLRTVNTCSCRMEEGALRVDANVSVRPAGHPELAVRSEVKNINSVRGVAKAVQYEIHRHIALKEAGQPVVNETRSFDPEHGVTVSMRDKEVVQDYRFLPEPNLPPLRLSSAAHRVAGVPDVDELRARLPQLPHQTRARLTRQYALSAASTQAMLTEEGLLTYFEAVLAALADGAAAPPCGVPEAVAVLLRMDVKALLNEHGVAFKDCRIPAASVADVFALRRDDVISTSVVTSLLAALWAEPGATPRHVVDRCGWAQVNDHAELESACRHVLKKNPEMVTKYLGSNEKKRKRLFNGWAKDVRVALGNRADMGQVTAILQRMLDEEQPR